MSISHMTPPLKRPRTQAHPPSKFLAAPTESIALLIVLSPLRKRQSEILTRNLSNFGANIHQPRDLSGVSADDILVITDSLSRAQTIVPPDPSVRYISTKWASKLLSTQSWHPPEQYLLTDSAPALPQPKKDRPAARCRLFPVWCTQPTPSDAAGKRTLLDGLPHFLCQRSTLSQILYPSPNQELCELLEEMAEKRVLERAGGSAQTADIRAHAYRLAAAALKCVPFRLQSRHDALTLHTFGPRVLAIVDEYLATGQVKEVNTFHSDPRLRALNELNQLYGVGPATAHELYERGFRTVQQLVTEVIKCPDTVPRSLAKYVVHQGCLTRTALSTARKFCAHVSKLCNEAPSLGVRFTLCGGFRRAQPSGHDIDLIYCRRSSHAHDTKSIITQIIDRLEKANILTSVLSLHHNTIGTHEKRYNREAHSIYPFAHDILHALATYANSTFRLDIVGVRDSSEYPFATLAWSGSTAFQRDIRRWVERKDWVFNHHGLFDRATGKRLQLTPAPKSEQDIFTAMGLIYRPPFERSA